jgi:hypothetical protein
MVMDLIWLEKKLAKFAFPEPNSGCWLWGGALNRDGYGTIYVQGSKRKLAHRIIFESMRRPVPEGMHLDHLCRNRLCVNPDHLEIVSPRTNVLRGQGLTAVNARKTHCVQGHALTADNVWLDKRKSHTARKCRICKAATIKRWRDTHKEQISMKNRLYRERVHG